MSEMVVGAQFKRAEIEKSESLVQVGININLVVKTLQHKKLDFS